MSAVRHKASTHLRAIELREAGWAIERIRDLLAKEGVDPLPSYSTIWTWTNPRRVERLRSQRRRELWQVRARQANFAWPGMRSPEWRLGRMRAMRTMGVSLTDIARVMSLDFPAMPVTKDTVRQALAENRPPLAYRQQEAA